MNDILKVIMYLVLALIVIYLFITISIGVDPITLVSKIGQSFETGKLGVTAAEPGVDCRDNRYVIALDSPKFFYKERFIHII